MGTLLRSLIHRMDGDVDAYYAKEALPFHARFYPIYRHLRGEGPCPMKELMGIAGTTFSALSQTIGQMRKLGLVELHAGTDKRVKTVTLSEQAEKLDPVLEATWAKIKVAHEQLDKEVGCDTYAVLWKLSKALERQSLYERIEAVCP